jgi:hypothetical protein
METGNEISTIECEEPVSVRVTTVARELVMYKLEALGIQEVKWDKGGIVRARDYILSMEKVTKSSIWNKTFVQHRILTPVKTAESVSDRT